LSPRTPIVMKPRSYARCAVNLKGLPFTVPANTQTMEFLSVGTFNSFTSAQSAASLAITDGSTLSSKRSGK
jgi:hypothetical protein